MSNLKKIALAIIILLIGILGFTTLVKAATPLKTEFKAKQINVEDDEELFKNLNLFCLVRDAQPPYGGYDRFAHIKIEGNVATNEDNKKTWSSQYNAKLAYMLYHATKIPMDGYIADKTSTLRALGWVFFPTWWENAKTQLGISGNINVEGCKIDDLIEAKEKYEELERNANTYASSYQGSEIQKQETGKKVTVTTTTINNIQYYKIGPFKCKFSNQLEDISVNTNNGNYTPSMCIQNKSGSEESVNINQIESEKNFYINIAANKNITSINYITIKGKKVRTYSVDLYIYKKDSTDIDNLENQNFAYFEKSYKDVEPSEKYDLNLPVDAELQIKKIDTSGKGNVKNIGFKVYSHVSGNTGWLQVGADSKITGYTANFDDATTLITSKNGVTPKITGMPVGKYTIYETDLPDKYQYLYTLGECDVPDGSRGNGVISVSKKTAKEIVTKDIYGTYIAEAKNTPVLGSLNITKIDVDSQEPLNDVGFKIYSKVKDKTGWLLIDEEKWELKDYTTFDKATEVYTKTIGKVKGITETIKKLPAGEYEVYETNIDKYQDLYVLDEMKVLEGAEGSAKITRRARKVATKTVEAKGLTETATAEAKNKKELGSLIIHKEDNAGNPLGGIGFKIYSEIPGKTGWLNINNGTGLVESYVGKIDEVKYDLITGNDGNTHIVTKLPAGKYKIYETSVGKYDDIYALTLTDVPGGTKAYVKNIGEVEVKATGTAKATLYTETNTPDLGSLKIKKIDKYTGETLPGIGFKVYSNLKGKEGWLTINSDNELTGYTTFANATEIFTQKDGITNIIEKLPAGEYGVYETNLGNYANTYKLEEIEVPGESGRKIAKFVENKTVEAKGTAESTLYEAENIPQFVKLSGYVWVDEQQGKASVRNNLYKENESEDDPLLDGILVRLIDSKTNEEVDKTETKNGGKYEFTNVLISKLADYYVEFEYDGLKYSNVTPILDKANGSKAAEGTVRTEFNNKFNEITNKTIIDGIEIEYDFDSENHTSTLKNSEKFVITSTTSEAGFNLLEQYQNGNVETSEDGMPEIKNINLGLYEREQPDLAVVKDIDNVIISVNGYNHIYKYDTRFVNNGEYSGGFNVGVKFGEKYGKQTYSRAIYKSDYDYQNENDKNKELKAYITYKIGIGNQSTSLTSKVNRLVDYYDTKYTLEKVGKSIDSQTGNITDRTIEFENTSYNNDYNKLELYTNMEVEHQDVKYIYVQFSMNKETIGSIMFDANGEEIRNKLLLDNVVEITSYTIFKEGNKYAGIDKDSQPGNALPGDLNTYEDDTDKAPALQLVVAEPRKITGTVFLDETSVELKIGQERIGNGEYDEGETTIPGVEVKMLKEDGTVVATAITDENGNFELSGFAPGNYTIVYTWGNTTYTVQDYKGTIYNETSRMNDNKWYQQTDIRYSDAIDNYETRKSIDSGANITKMESTTPTMNFGVELNDRNSEGLIDVTSGIDRVEFIIKNIDFGIVERPRQKLDISKNATAMKIILGNNMGTLDAKIEKDTNGNVILKGTGLEMLTATPQEETTKGALLWAQVDSDILQNSTIKIEYKISVANNSELDYDSEDYYKYGIPVGNKITMKPTGVYDYLDGTVLDTEKATENSNEGWKEISRAEYDNEFATEPTIIDQYLNKYSSTIVSPDGTITNIEGYEEFIAEHYDEIREYTVELVKELRETLVADKTILRNSNLENTTLEPGQSNTVTLYTSQVLAVKDEIDFNNSAEITKVERNTETGRIITPRDSALYDSAEEITVTPPTGGNQDYVLPIVLGVSTLIILGAGIVLIKKKVLNK